MDASTDAGSKSDAGNRLTDNEIVAVVGQYLDSQILLEQTVRTKSPTAAVRDLAQSIATSCIASRTRQTALIQSLGLTKMADNAPTEAIRMAGTATFNAMSANPPSKTDGIYLDWLVQSHESLLMTLDTLLVPSSSRAALTTELGVVRSEVAARLTQARTLRMNLSDGGVPFDAGTSDGGTSDGGTSDGG